LPAVPAYRGDVARTHNGLGRLFSQQGKRAEAAGEYRTARDGFARLAADFPAVPDYRAELALADCNLGAAFSDLGRDADAEAAVRAALAVREKLVADFPAVTGYRVDLAETCHGLGELLRGRDTAAALDWHGKAIALLEPV